jgi:hypothetical protein
MTPDTVQILRADSDEGPLTVTRKAFDNVYRLKGYAIIGIEPTSARPEAFVADSPIGSVLAWVDGIPLRARQALEAELDRSKPRRSLVDRLEAIIDEAGAGDVEP